MAKILLDIKPTGWVKLDGILAKMQNYINEIKPKAGDGVDINEDPDGMQICLHTVPTEGGDANSVGGGGRGTPVSIYGALNGAPAVFHLLQSSPPTPIP